MKFSACLAVVAVVAVAPAALAAPTLKTSGSSDDVTSGIQQKRPRPDDLNDDFDQASFPLKRTSREDADFAGPLGLPSQPSDGPVRLLTCAAEPNEPVKRDLERFIKTYGKLLPQALDQFGSSLPATDTMSIRYAQVLEGYLAFMRVSANIIAGTAIAPVPEVFDRDSVLNWLENLANTLRLGLMVGFCELEMTDKPSVKKMQEKVNRAANLLDLLWELSLPTKEWWELADMHEKQYNELSNALEEITGWTPREFKLSPKDLEL